MIIGLLSDTHGNLPRTRLALQSLREARADHIIHCGDLGSEEVLSQLLEVKDTGTPVTAVVGNVDEWDAGLKIYAKAIGISLHDVARLSLDNLQCAVCHGHRPADMDLLLETPGLDLLFTGHTHQPRDERIGALRIINPGAVHRAREPGVAILDTSTGTLTRIPLP